MNLTFEEACMAVADLFEACPEMWADGGSGYDSDWNLVGWESPRACHWCATGGVLAAMGFGRSDKLEKLDAIAESIGYSGGDYRSAAVANDKGGRLVAIKMLRIASGELKP